MGILIVDDSEEQRDLLAATLKQAGHRSILLAGSAAEALMQLGVGGATVPSGYVDIVLMDLLMPDMDGLEAIRSIREDERLEHLPVIVVTARTETADLTAAYTAGATDYIRKPVIPAELIARVSFAMSLKGEFDNRKEREHALATKTQELSRTVQDLQTLRGTICLCANCKRVKDPSGFWQRVEDFLEEKLSANITSGVCSKCAGERRG
jgi:DNA-binding response OmpR family regulator